MPVNNGNAEVSDLPWALSRPLIKANLKSDPGQNVNRKYRVDEFNEPSPRLSGIRSLLPLPGGDLLTGGTDLKIRRWDQCRFYLASSLPLCYFITILKQIFSPASLNTDLRGATVFVGQQLRAFEMMKSTKLNLAPVCSLCR